MRLYNTLSRQVDELKPISPPKVTVYSCGPTVYDYPHIGNWFTFLRYDILIRTLQAAGYTPDWVMNITDVGHLTSDADEGEDKLEKGAQREGQTAWQIAEKYTAYFEAGLGRLHILRPAELPRATEHIEEQIDLIKDLETKGFTYKISDGIYFDTSKFPTYGELAKLDVEHLKEGARVNINPQKKNSTDFALWKFSPEGFKRDMEWDSPWGKGFPGWHLECSAMALKYLGNTLDIHAGGIDHIPIHHTNEIAQSEAVTGQPFAHIWVHMNHITASSVKISKSLGNLITLEDIEQKHIPLEAFRLLVLESHYRTQAEFSWDNLAAAHNRLRDLQAMADLKWQVTETSKLDDGMFTTTISNIVAALTDDLNTPQALALLSESANQILANGLSKNQKDNFQAFLNKLDELFGLELANRTDISDKQKQLIAAREAARGTKDWANSDKLRDQLATEQLAVNDTEAGPIWRRL